MLVPALFEVDGVSSVDFIRVFLETDLPSAAGVNWGHLHTIDDFFHVAIMFEQNRSITGKVALEGCAAEAFVWPFIGLSLKRPFNKLSIMAILANKLPSCKV